MLMAERFYSNPGSSIKPVYTAKLDDKGMISLIETGKENIQEYIDSFAEDTDINVILARCAAGDTSVLSKYQGTYGDFLDVPKTYRDFLQTAIDGQNFFDALPVDIKSKFGNSFEQWMSQIGSKEWMEAMSVLDGQIGKEEVIKE